MSQNLMDEAFAVLRNCVLSKRPRSEWLRAILNTLDPSDEACWLSLLRVGHALSWGSQQHALRHIQSPPSDLTPLALALYCLLQEDVERRDACVGLLPAEAIDIVSWVLDHEQKGYKQC